MSASAADTKLGDGVVEAVTDGESIAGTGAALATYSGEADEQDYRFIIHKAINLFERNATVPCAQYQRLEGEVQAKIQLIELTLMTVLKCRRNTSL